MDATSDRSRIKVSSDASKKPSGQSPCPKTYLCQNVAPEEAAKNDALFLFGESQLFGNLDGTDGQSDARRVGGHTTRRHAEHPYFPLLKDINADQRVIELHKAIHYRPIHFLNPVSTIQFTF